MAQHFGGDRKPLCPDGPNQSRRRFANYGPGLPTAKQLRMPLVGIPS